MNPYSENPGNYPIYRTGFHSVEQYEAAHSKPPVSIIKQIDSMTNPSQKEAAINDFGRDRYERALATDRKLKEIAKRISDNSY